MFVGELLHVCYAVMDLSVPVINTSISKFCTFSEVVVTQAKQSSFFSFFLRVGQD